MSRFTKSFAAALAGAAVVATAMAATAAVSADRGTAVAALEDGPKAEYMLVKFHADWCPKCRALQPAWDSARSQLADSDANVLFVQLDRTDEARSRQSALLATELDLTEAWNKYRRVNGSMVLFNAKTGEAVKEFSRGTTASDIQNAIRNAG